MLEVRVPLVAAAVAALVLPGLQVEATPTSIGVFFDADATQCAVAVAPLSPFNVYVSAVLGTDAAASGITGAAFRVDGLNDMVSSITPNPASFASIGNPIAAGCEIAFPTCMAGEGPRNVVLLYTLACSAGPASPGTVTVSYVLTPSGDPPWLPSVVLCDDPNYTRLYVAGGQGFINNGTCAVGVQPATWTRVKALFHG